MEERMKKLLMILVVLAFILSACNSGADVGNNNNDNNNNNNNANNNNDNNANNDEDMDEPGEDTEEVVVEPTEEATEEPTELPPPEPIPFELTSPAFVHGDPIPVKFSCDGENISPELVWGDPPEGTQSFVLIFDDPDAPGGTWIHWVLYNIPAEARGLAEGITADPILADGSMNGKNSWGTLGYGGPCPPSGTHRYFFKLYAIDIVLDVEPGLKKNQVLSLLSGHILGELTLMGTFSR
jgi:Raf kinase inhibitor-like YbhB/YbcL family protein